MSVIAWDGKTLAADKRCLIGSTIRSSTKIFRVGDSLVGLSGDFIRALEVLEWLKLGDRSEKFPAMRGDRHGNLLVVDARGDVWKYEEGPIPYQLDGPHAAAGCGDESALVAMHMGASAAEAVAIVSLFNNGCGNGVDTLTLEP